jgi:hypothetical protein|tara:strand:+ start:2689 stop:6534 length:3846 start_codon:yes stop_codon:yes gene_type:complete
MAENNSIQTMLPELLRLFNNSLESFEKVNQAITSSRDSVTVNIQNNDGTNSRITIPSFGYLKNSVDRLDTNINTLTNFNDADSSIRLPDGTFRKLVLAKLPTEAQDLTSINSINQFNVKPNWFFEELINPLLYISFNITGQAPIDTERAIVQRYILDTNSQSKINFFDSEYNGNSELVRSTFLQQIVEKNISYVLDEAVVDLPPRDKRYSGNFSVIRIGEDSVTETVNGVEQTVVQKLYKLNKVFYTDSNADFPDTIQLKVGDSLEVVSTPIDTRYTVTQIDTSTNSVIVRLQEGSRTISIGADILKIGSSLNNLLEVDVTVGFSERCVTFIKPIDPDSKIPAVNWSPGSGFYTNDLNTVDSNGAQQNLADYYQQNAVDFGRYLLSFAQDKIPTSREGLIPNAPVLSSEDFTVSLINGQVSNSDAIVQLQTLNNQKNTVQSTLTELDTAISQSRARIQTTNYSTEVERDADKNALQGLITERSSQAKLYASVVTEIDASAQDNSVSSISPKYRVRGFWAMPAEKSAPATGIQDIIKFKYRYRYLSADGAANPVSQFNYTDGSGTSQGAFSNYVIIDSVLRPRTRNTITGLYEWTPIDDDNADSVNINQLDIPIRKGEQVEIEAKSISEAGWPSNPLESEWSTTVRVEFPADLSSDSAIDSILAQNQEDLALVALNENLESIGLPTHLSSSFTANETYYAHSSPVIASGFLSENQTPIDLFTKLNEMQNQLDLFAEILNSTQGELNTTLVDDTGNTYKLRRNATTNIFAGFYSQEVRDLDDPRGAIISKTYFINIANSSQTALQLIARISGSRTRMVKQSENPTYSNADVISGATILPATYSWLDNSAINQTNTRSTFRADDVDYNTIRKYDLSPILLTNPTVTAATKYGQTISLPPFQSTQNKNQFIYSRFSDVSDDNNFYSYINPSNDFTFNLDSTENFYNATLASAVSTPVTEFIWGGGFLLAAPNEPTTEATYPTNDDVVQVSIAHPWLSSYTAYRKEYIGLTGDITTLPAVPTLAEHVDMTSGGNGTAAVMFRQSRFAPLKTDEAYGQLQAIYLNENVVDLTLLAAAMPTTFNSGQTLQASPSLTGVGTTTSVSPLAGVNYSRNAKTSFEGFDQYALGQQSCGSYLFVSSDNHQNIQVDGDAIQSYEVIGFGQQNSINIPLVFQYRMTDYFGVTSGSGLGNIAGDSTGNTVNLTYAKKIGFDIYPNNSDVVQFDIEISANYRSDRLSIKQFPKATVTKGLNDLEKVVRGLRPSLNQAAISANASGGSVTSDFSGIQA